MSVATGDLRDDLTGLLRSTFGRPDLTVTPPVRLSGGASRETWAFDAVAAGGTRPLVLRRDVPGRVPQRGFAHEVAAIASVTGRGVPVPRVVAHSDEAGSLGGPFMVMDRIEGETLGHRIVRSDALAGARAGLAAHCGRVLGRIHTAPAGPQVPEQPDPLAQLRRHLDASGWPSPVFEAGLRWLTLHRPEPVPAALVHGDFRNGNLMVGPDGLRAVLDWELCGRGDPLTDLGWLCVRAWRFGGAAPVGGFGEYDDLLAAYREETGVEVDRRALFWWEVYGTIRWGVDCLGFARRHLSGETRSVEMAAIGRRACEQEYDVLRMLAAAGSAVR